MMRHNYIPAPYSVFSGISKLAPGTIMEVSADGGPGLQRRYWSMEAAIAQGKSLPFEGGPQAAVDALEQLLLDSVGRQMQADVPLGAFLSGGIDSSTIVALMQAQSARPINTFTIGFEEKGYNEALHAKAVATHLGTNHTELYLREAELLDVVPGLASVYSEPFSDSSQIPTFLVSRLARQHVTVSLSGDGGDELFGGYGRYFSVQDLQRRFGRIPKALRQGLAQSIRCLSPHTWNRMSLPARVLTPGYFGKKTLEIWPKSWPMRLWISMPIRSICRSSRIGATKTA